VLWWFRDFDELGPLGGSVGRQNEWNSPGVFVMIPAPSFPQQSRKLGQKLAFSAAQ